MDRGPLACTDAERRAALALAAELRAAGRAPRLEARWVRPGWPVWQALCAIAGAVGSVVSVDHALTGLIIVGAALAVSVGHGRGRLPLGRARATQDVVAPAPAPRAVTLVVLAAVDRPRTNVLDRVPAPLLWLQGALLLTAAFAAARLAGAEGTLLGACQLVPAVVLLLAAAGFLDAAFEPPGPSDAAATRAAVELTAVPWADIVLVGGGELGLRARLRADSRPPEQVVLLWLEPAAQPGWRTAHSTLASIAEDTGAARRRGRALPAGARPALALGGPDGVLGDLARTVVERLEPYSEAARSTK
jgi:hypothetical protein